MNFRAWMPALMAVSLLALPSCDQPPRPGEPEVRRLFLSSVPSAQVIEVKHTEDEVVAASFEVIYTTPESDERRTADVFFLLKDDQWQGQVRPR